MASSAALENTKNTARGGGVSSSFRQRRRTRLVHKGRSSNTSPPSPPTTQQPQQSLHTVSEFKSADHARPDKYKLLSVSVDATTETTILSAETSETSPADSVRVRKLPHTPTNSNSGAAPLPQSILTTTQTFPPQGEQPTPLPVRSHASTAVKNGSKKHSRVPRDNESAKQPLQKNSRLPVEALEPLPATHMLPRRQRPRSQSLWDGKHGKELGATSTPKRKTNKMLPQASALSSSTEESRRSISPLKRFSKPTTQSFDEPSQRLRRSKPARNGVVASLRPRPRLKRHSTAPSFTEVTTPTTNVADDILMDRARCVRRDLMNFEMQELAAEAERAAESGMERFVGSASKFGGVAETPPHRPAYVDDGFVADGVPIYVGDRGGGGGAAPSTPSRRKTLADALAHPMVYTPSYFARKKIPVTSLRNFAEVVPRFGEMHENARWHLRRVGVNPGVLPEHRSQRSLVRSDTDESEAGDGGGVGEGADEASLTAPSIAASHAESISSFSSYAVASLASLKEIIEYVNRPRSQVDGARPPASTAGVCRDGKSSVPRAAEHLSPPRRRAAESAAEGQGVMSITTGIQQGIDTQMPHVAMHFKTVVGPIDSDSDDSSVEFYGHKSPVDLNRSASSNASKGEVGRAQLMPSLSSQPSRSNISTGRRRKRRIGSSPSVSFETEKASYQALLDKLHHRHSPSVSFDVDTNSCTPSLTNMDIDIMPSSPMVGTNKSTPMAKFLSKIGFSRSASAERQNKSSKALEEDNEHFVANFFYTSRPPGGVEAFPGGSLTLKLNINPERDRDDPPYCLSGCGPEDLLPVVPVCDVATRYADLVFDFFKVGGRGGDGARPERGKPGIIDPMVAVPEPPDPRPKWATTWGVADGGARGGHNGRQAYTPPKLSSQRAAADKDGLFCSSRSSVQGDEYDDAMACPGVKEPAMCPEIQNKIGCSPEYPEEAAHVAQHAASRCCDTP